ncbi:retrovirus-related pol polyprotein from transposon TNT 1-94 [Tanacetum coccineum]|uniref:Retrovirus-related pol polyprotein from transposon TNT 1-94 n=1 Tax=Tanacetum coccineum TaxID=301880 RepID=A0ABQ4Z852_9ASTR
MNQSCEDKEIKREFSVARTPQQNGVAERKNRTLIEVARTMLADSKLPTTFWAEAINTACYVQNRLDGKVDEGFFVGYSVNSKAFRVFNSRTRIVKETLHITFLENKPNVARSGPEWLFDIDTLTKSMNYKPVVTGNQSNANAGTKACDDACKARVETMHGKDYILLLLGLRSTILFYKVPSTEEPRVNQEKDANINITNNINTVSLTVNVAGIEDNVVDENIVYGCVDDPNMPNLEEICLEPKKVIQALTDPSWIEAMQDELLQNKKDERGIVVRNKARLVAQGYTQEEGIEYDAVFDLSAFLYGKIEEEIYIYQPPGFEDPKFPDRVYKIEKALYGLHQAPKAWPDIMFVVCACARFQVTPKVSHLHVVKRIFRYLKGQPKLGLWYVKDSPFDLEPYTNSDYAGASLDKKSIIGGCQFLGSRLISWICKKQTMMANSITKAEYVATLNCCVQIIHKGWLKWNATTVEDRIEVKTANSKVNVVAHYLVLLSINKSTENADFDEIVDFINANPIRYALIISPAIYVSYIEQFWSIVKTKIVNNETQIRAKVDGKTIVITESSVRRDLHFNDEDGIACLTSTEIFENLQLMRYEKLSDKLTFYKSNFSP